MNTQFLLMAQYDGRAVIPVELVCRDYFNHLEPREFIRKATEGKIKIPVVAIEPSQKAARGVHLVDLAKWIDDRAEAARKECAQLAGGKS